MTNTEELLKSRRALYGDIRDNTNCQAELKVIMRKYAMFKVGASSTSYSQRNTTAHYECLEYVLEKLARIITGVAVQPDSYEDMKGYTELARKIAMGESTAP